MGTEVHSDVVHHSVAAPLPATMEAATADTEDAPHTDMAALHGVVTDVLPTTTTVAVAASAVMEDTQATAVVAIPTVDVATEELLGAAAGEATAATVAVVATAATAVVVATAATVAVVATAAATVAVVATAAAGAAVVGIMVATITTTVTMMTIMMTINLGAKIDLVSPNHI